VQRAIGGVLDHDEVVLLGEGNDLLVELARGAGAGRVIRKVEHQHLGLGQDVGGDRLQVGEEMVFGGQLQVMNEASVILSVGAEHRVTPEHRVTRSSHEDIIAGIDQAARQDG